MQLLLCVNVVIQMKMNEYLGSFVLNRERAPGAGHNAKYGMLRNKVKAREHSRTEKMAY